MWWFRFEEGFPGSKFSQRRKFLARIFVRLHYSFRFAVCNPEQYYASQLIILCVLRSGVTLHENYNCICANTGK